MVKYVIWFNKVTLALKACTPTRKNVPASRYNNPVPWWDEGCYKLKRLRKVAFKKWQYFGIPDDYKSYVKADKTLRRTFSKKKIKSYRDFAETIDFNATYVCSKTKIFKNKWVKTSISNHDKKAFREKAETVLNKIAPHRNPDLSKDSIQDLHGKQVFFFDTPFDLVELNAAIESRNQHFGCGFDDLDYFTLRRFPIQCRLELLDIYNQMHISKKYPRSWQESYVHFISKPDRSGFRPIAMTSCLCKIYEIMVKNRFQWYCEHNVTLPSEKSGFRKGRSCNDNLTNLTLYM